MEYACHEACLRLETCLSKNLHDRELARQRMRQRTCTTGNLRDGTCTTELEELPCQGMLVREHPSHKSSVKGAFLSEKSKGIEHPCWRSRELPS